MEQNIIQTDIHRAVEAIKVAILQTRRKVMIQANNDSLALNYSIGGYISCRKQTSHWGDKVLDTISSQLQQELPGLRGFTKSNLKKMCVFYEGWKEFFGIIFFKGNNSVTSNKISPVSADNDEITIGQLITDQFDKATLEAFLTVQFTHHYEILRRSESINERLFYIRRVASEFWSVDKLKYNIREQLYLKEGTMPNNFAVTLHDGEQKQKAMRAFRKNYKLDFIEIDDVDEWDEHKVETKIVENIKRFIMALGADFSYMGNQYRLIVDDKEYFIDLLFFNRRLRCLVAIELKWTEFLPEYVGKMNFYLSALDDLVRLPNENPSIGIILCRGQKQRTVEYALRDTRKPMGVATYRAANELPEEYGEVLGGLEGLKELM